MSSLKSDLSPEQRIQRWIELVEQGAPVEDIQQAEFQIAEALKQAPFEIRQQIPFFQQFINKVTSSTAFQEFRLPGRDRVVEDRRDEAQSKASEAAKESAKDAAKHAEKTEKGKVAKDTAEQMRLQEGKLVKEKDRSYENYLGERGLDRGGLDQKVAEDRVERLLSAFERMVIARFEDGKTIAHENPEGKAKFLEKTEGQWRDFFKAFFDRTIKKTELVSEIREFLLRGLVPKGSKGVLIGDLHLESGRIEKFVRFSILAEALAKLKKMSPGDVIGKGALAELTGEELMFLALAASRGRGFAAAMKESEGKFVGSRAEAQAAEALGLPIDQQLRQKARIMRDRKTGGFGRDFFGGEGPAEELPYQFVPWWRWGNLHKPGKFRWTTAAFYGTLLALALIGIAALTYRLIGG